MGQTCEMTNLIGRIRQNMDAPVMQPAKEHYHLPHLRGKVEVHSISTKSFLAFLDWWSQNRIEKRKLALNRRSWDKPSPKPKEAPAAKVTAPKLARRKPREHVEPGVTYCPTAYSYQSDCGEYITQEDAAELDAYYEMRAANHKEHWSRRSKRGLRARELSRSAEDGKIECL